MVINQQEDALNPHEAGDKSILELPTKLCKVDDQSPWSWNQSTHNRWPIHLKMVTNPDEEADKCRYYGDKST